MTFLFTILPHILIVFLIRLLSIYFPATYKVKKKIIQKISIFFYFIKLDPRNTPQLPSIHKLSGKTKIIIKNKLPTLSTNKYAP